MSDPHDPVDPAIVDDLSDVSWPEPSPMLPLWATIILLLTVALIGGIVGVMLLSR